LQERFLAQTMLCCVQYGTGGANRYKSFGHVNSSDRHVFEFERHDTDAARELRDSREIVVRSAYFKIGHLAGRRIVVGREDMHAVAQPPGGNGEHSPELTAAEDADGRTR
jgi:hypothetical protein